MHIKNVRKNIMLKKNLKLAVVLGSLLSATAVYADNHSFTLGYGQSKISDIDLKGVNAQYRYEWNSPLSLITSVSYMKGDTSEKYGTSVSETDVKYLSYMMGPAYRFNDYVSVYATTGISNINVKGTDFEIGGTDKESEKISKTELAYGAGFVVNPTENVAINVGYEGTTWKHADEKRLNVNGWNASLGFRF